MARATYRPTSESDLEAEHAIFCRAEGALLRAHAYEWSDPPVEAFVLYLRHLLTTDPERCFVAERDDRVVGFTAAIVRDDTWFFSMLFIDPDAQGQGIGGQLFERAVAGAPSRRLTITDSIQPISNALYARQGLIPTTPILAFTGEPRMTKADDLEPIDATPSMLVALDRAAYGFDRAADHRYWGSRRSLTIWARGGDPIGYAYVAPDGSIGPLAGRDPTSSADTLRAELARMPKAFVYVPGSARTLVATALAGHLRIESPPGLLLTSDGVVPPTALAISSYGLY